MIQSCKYIRNFEINRDVVLPSLDFPYITEILYQLVSNCSPFQCTFWIFSHWNLIFFCKSSKSREKENWNILIVWREVTEKCFLKILKIEPAVPGLIPSDKWCETDQFYSLPASNALWRKEINENRTSGENRKLVSWFNLDLSLIVFFYDN